MGYRQRLPARPSCPARRNWRVSARFVARRPWDDVFFRQHLTTNAPKMTVCSYDSWEEFLKLTTYVQTHLETRADFEIEFV